MYSILIIIHNILRWGVLFGGLYAITKSVLGLLNKSEFSKSENLAHVIFVMFCHTQLLIGIILYFVSPIVDEAFKSGDIMKNSAYRFVAVEHLAGMIIAITLIQTGRIVSKKAKSAESKHKKALIFFSLGMLIILAMIPWHKALFPGM